MYLIRQKHFGDTIYNFKVKSGDHEYDFILLIAKRMLSLPDFRLSLKISLYLLIAIKMVIK